MTNFTPTPEAVQKVGEAIAARRDYTDSPLDLAHTAIAAFVEAEGLTIVNAADQSEWAWRGPWRKRD